MCDCISMVNAKLAPDHVLNATMSFRPGHAERALIGLIRKDVWKLETRRAKPSTFVCSYCPFCGEKYAEPAADVPAGVA